MSKCLQNAKILAVYVTLRVFITLTYGMQLEIKRYITFYQVCRYTFNNTLLIKKSDLKKRKKSDEINSANEFQLFSKLFMIFSSLPD